MTLFQVQGPVSSATEETAGDGGRTMRATISMSVWRACFFQKLCLSLTKLFNIDNYNVHFPSKYENWRSEKFSNIPKSNSLYVAEPVLKPMFWWRHTHAILTKPPSRYSPPRRDFLFHLLNFSLSLTQTHTHKHTLVSYKRECDIYKYLKERQILTLEYLDSEGSLGCLDSCQHFTL